MTQCGRNWKTRHARHHRGNKSARGYSLRSGGGADRFARYRAYGEPQLRRQQLTEPLKTPHEPKDVAQTLDFATSQTTSRSEVARRLSQQPKPAHLRANPSGPSAVVHYSTLPASRYDGQGHPLCLDQWESLEVYLRDPLIEIDNNLVEKLRPGLPPSKKELAVFLATPSPENAVP